MSGIRRPGRLGPFVDGYRARLQELGYAPTTVRSQLAELGQLGRWMASEGIEVKQLDRRVIELFLAAQQAGGYRYVPSVRRFSPLLDYLRSEGVLAERPLASPLEELIAEYREWLLVERGLAAATVVGREWLARRFLGERCSAADELGVANLTGSAVTGFLAREAARVSAGTVKCRVVELRSLLRFLHVRGLAGAGLADSVPPVAGWRDAGVPAGVDRADVERLLACCDRSTLVGARDFAMVMLLVRLGLRSVEVARLELEDLRWRAGEIVACGKGGRRGHLPLPADVGEALVDYLSLRGPRAGRHVFLTVEAPIRPIRPDLVGDIVRRGCRRAGLPQMRAHRLRHALATELLNEGASLIDIGQVLRHKDLASTAIYAKVDLGRLRQVAQPWPGVGR